MATQAELELVFRLRDQVSQNLGRIQTVMRSLESTAKQLSRSLGAPGSLAAGGIVGSALAIGFAFDSTEEQATIAFATIFKSAERANAMVDRLKQTALEAPFGFTDILRAGQRLAAAGFGEDEISRKMTTISDAISSTGDISRDKLDQITLAVARARSAGVFDMGMIESFSAAGINVVGALAAQEGTSEFAMSKRLSALSGRVAAGPMVDQIFRALDARFHGLSATQASSMQGVVNNIRDIVQQMLGAVLLPLFTRTRDVLRFIAYWLQQIRDWFKTLSQPIQDMVKFWGSWVLWAAAAVVVLGALVTILTPIVAGITTLATWLAALAGVLVLIDPAFALVGLALVTLYLAWQNNWLGIRDITYGIVQSVTLILGWLGQQIATFLDDPLGTMGAVVLAAWSYVVGLARWLATAVLAVLQFAADGWLGVIGLNTQDVMGAVATGWGYVVSVFNWLADTVGPIISGAWTGVVDWFVWLISTAISLVQAGWQAIVDLFNWLWSGATTAVSNLAQTVVAWWTWMIDAIKASPLGQAIGAAAGIIGDVSRAIGGALGITTSSAIPTGGGTQSGQSAVFNFNGPVYANDIEDMVVKALDTASRKGRTG